MMASPFHHWVLETFKCQTTRAVRKEFVATPSSIWRKIDWSIFPSTDNDNKGVDDMNPQEHIDLVDTPGGSDNALTIAEICGTDVSQNVGCEPTLH